MLKKAHTEGKIIALIISIIKAITHFCPFWIGFYLQNTYICTMKKQYLNVQRLKLTKKRISEALGYDNGNSFRTSSAHDRIMSGIDELLGVALEFKDKKD